MFTLNSMLPLFKRPRLHPMKELEPTAARMMSPGVNANAGNTHFSAILTLILCCPHSISLHRHEPYPPRSRSVDQQFNETQGLALKTN